MELVVAIVGRPNVGKSTLFNRLVGRRAAISDDVPGTTRDWNCSKALLGKTNLKVIDTAGFNEKNPNQLEKNILDKTRDAISLSDIILFMIDARLGISSLDESYALIVRKFDKPVILIANKCEPLGKRYLSQEAYKLGLGEPILFSSQHSIGFEYLEKILIEQNKNKSKRSAEDEKENINLRMAIVGRPNAGKSTLINKMLMKDRVLTGPEPGITRDSIRILFKWQKHLVELVDTAGLRKKARANNKVEKLAALSTIDEIKFAQVVILMLDCTEALTKQDLLIASRIEEEGRLLVVAANKWDLVEEKELMEEAIRNRLQETLSQIKGVPLLKLSAKSGYGINQLMREVFKCYSKWNSRISTGKLNRWLEGMIISNPPPMAKGKQQKIRFITQSNIRPPTFALFSSKPDFIPESYKRYLMNGLRKSFSFEGIPIRLMFRKSVNPYKSNF